MSTMNMELVRGSIQDEMHEKCYHLTNKDIEVYEAHENGDITFKTTFTALVTVEAEFLFEEEC